MQLFEIQEHVFQEAKLFKFIKDNSLHLWNEEKEFNKIITLI